ncbi:MAG: hypothetical protein ACPLKV_00260 [Minisyncoccia bacterium]
MKFNFRISKLANFYFFVSNLCEWHFSCRKDYNTLWLKQTGQLKPNEFEILQKFKTICQKYGFTSSDFNKTKYLGKYFYLYPEKQCFKKLQANVEKNEFELIKQVFQIFEPRFNKIWLKNKNPRSITLLKNELQKNNWKNLLKDVELIFGKSNQKINIIVIFSPLKGEGVTAAGSAILDFKNIILELPQLKNNSWEMDYSIGVFAHELAHVLFEKNNGRKLIKKEIRQLKLPEIMPENPFSTENIINEAVVESFVPFGYLTQKYSNFRLAHCLLNTIGKIQKRKRVPKNPRFLIRYLTWYLYPLAIIYTENKKELDDNFIFYAGKMLDLLIKNGII